ncbi:MAG: TrkA family potassium uptake protein, partial [Clostridia bacterium]|nr:TrkA family potassium uptake protein [Clostridia bacterium]
LGRFGASIAKTLSENGVQVMGIDTDEELVQEMSGILTRTVQADAMDEKVMASLGVDEFDTALVTMGSDLKASCVTTMVLKEIGIPNVIAKASDEFHGRMLEKLGASKVLYPERDMGRRVAYNLISNKLLDFLEITDSFSMAEIAPRTEWVGKTLTAINMRAVHGVNVIAIRGADGTVTLPAPNMALKRDDTILVVANKEDLVKLEN